MAQFWVLIVILMRRMPLVPPAVPGDVDRANSAEDGTRPAGGGEQLPEELRGARQTAVALLALSVFLISTIVNRPPRKAIFCTCLTLLIVSFYLSLFTALLMTICWKSSTAARWGRNLNCGIIIAIAVSGTVWVLGDIFATSEPAAPRNL